jgi:fermentation-respiration switch protein FrsA (DUF1100 family)
MHDTLGNGKTLRALNIIDDLKDSLTSFSTTEKLLFNVPGSYWISLKNYHPIEIVKTTYVPMFFLQGERDYQVTTIDLELWKKTLIDHKNIKYKSYKKLNHFFFEGKGIPNPQEYEEQNNVPLYVIEDISKWIVKNQ